MSNITPNDAILELYRTTVRNMLASTEPGVVPNASNKHASIIIEELIKSAKLRFFAYCGKLSCDVWSQTIIDQLVLATMRGVDVQIIVADEINATLPPALKSAVRILNLSEIKDCRAAFENINHFAVADGKSFRLEKDKTMRTAIFAANRPDVAREVEDIFAVLRENSNAA